MIVKTEQDLIINYLSDAANVKGVCTAVYLPNSYSDIIDIIKECYKNNTKITISGNRTGLTGAAIPNGGVILSTENLNKILEVNKDTGFITTMPGVLLSKLIEEVENQGLFYPADPTEKNCFIGSTVATNASGARTFKFGATRNYVEGIKLITSNGDTITINRGEYFADNNIGELFTDSGKKLTFEIPNINLPVSKNSAGYYCKYGMDLIDLFIGSEGTLGIIYEIKLKLLKLPQKFFSVVVFFDNINTCFNFIEEIKLKKNKQINPSAIEFMDKNALHMLKDDYPNIPLAAEACLWIEQDTFELEYEELINVYIKLFEDLNIDTQLVWFATSDKELKEFQKFRHAIPSKVNEFIAKNNFTKLGTDIAVPDKSFKEFYFEAIKEVENNNLDYVVYGHFGNSHIHLNMLPKNFEEREKAKAIYLMLCKKAVFYSGTISAEHGIGKLKSQYLDIMYNKYIMLKFAKIKKTFDPKLILNIGNIINEKYYNEI